MDRQKVSVFAVNCFRYYTSVHRDWCFGTGLFQSTRYTKLWWYPAAFINEYCPVHYTFLIFI